MNRSFFTGFLLLVGGLASAIQAQPPELIAPTEPLTPEEQLKKFHLPEGFEIQLVVSEPLIGQPMNLNFDAQGRLWITSSVEYPYPAQGDVEPRPGNFESDDEPHAPRDNLTVVEGIGPDGKPAKVWNFVGGLNIPIGTTPMKDAAIVYSIPQILLVRDTDGDGKADEQKVLFEKFGNVDTHGMASSFTPWVDGWIYACHGFRNTSHIKLPDGSVLTMNSGNTYRFKADGSAFEQWTWGQVNPFGLTIDPLGNMYTADCHSKPLTMLLNEAYYSSFGKPHDGLGYGPDMINHNHGSTGICGPAYYAANQFPEDFRNNIFLCNPVTGRVHRDKLKQFGSTYMVDTQPDFLTCDDPWFRPVDVQMGPDGALYVADFYNCIIGHYEVELKHPRRDRTHGRVWRIVYKGNLAQVNDLTQMDLPQLLEQLNHPNLLIRIQATNEIVNRFGNEAIEPVKAGLANGSEFFQAHALWILHRLNALDQPLVMELGNSFKPLVRVHLVNSLAEREEWSDEIHELVLRRLIDNDAFVQRAAAHALGKHPSPDNLQPLLRLYSQVPAEDTHLKHMVKIALRNQFRDTATIAALPQMQISQPHRLLIVELLQAVPSQPAADALAGMLENLEVSREAFLTALSHVARYGSADALNSLGKVIRFRFESDLDFQYEQLLALQQGLETRGAKTTEEFREWVSELTLKLLQGEQPQISWEYLGSLQQSNRGNPWAIQRRKCQDGQEAAFFCTLPSGEQATGIQRSSNFAAPARLSFFIAGHDGFPEQPLGGKNLVRLRDAQTNTMLKETSAPRNDTAQKVEWDLSNLAGRDVYLELVDQDTANAYAWLAVGRFSLVDLNPSAVNHAEAPVELARKFQLQGLIPDVEALIKTPVKNQRRLLPAIETLLVLKPDFRLSAIVQHLRNRPSVGFPQTLVKAILERNDEEIQKLLAETMKQASAAQQRQLAEILVSDKQGAEALLQLVEDGQASARLLNTAEMKQKLSAVNLPNWESRVNSLTAGLPPADETRAAVIATQLTNFSPENASIERGAELFKKQCMICHKIGEEGAIVGPQLDGIGIRGPQRLLEDLLDPNRNVDAAFRTSTILLNNGQVQTGLLRREEGNVLVFADQKGKEFRISKDDIEEMKQSAFSLMPTNFFEVIPEEDLPHLLQFLLEQQQKPNEQANSP